MAKKKKRRARNYAHKHVQPNGWNRHHLLYMGKNWDYGMAKEMRNYFIFRIPIAVHNEIHNKVLRDVPKPPPEALKPLYLAFLDERWKLDRLGVLEALEWLSARCDYEPFCEAMRIQRDFLAKKLG